MAKRKKKPEGRERNAALILFLSLNMILLAFFILLTAMAAPNETKEAKLAIEIRRAFKSFGGSFLGLGETLAEEGISRDQNPIPDSEVVEAYLGELTRYFEANKEVKTVSYEATSEGMIIHISSDFAFKPGSARMDEEGIGVYNNIQNLILRTSNDIIIEGHTDNVPIRSSEVRDNWELSAKRALAVFRFFIASREIPANRFKVVGRGAQKPLASNLTEEGRNRNRRVSIKFLGKLRQLDEDRQ